jgi:iron complex outermembrane receptor protein
MLFRTKLVAGVATTALFLAMATAASAQSTGSLEIDEAEDADAVEAVVVTGVRSTRSIEGVVRNETAPKARTSIDQEYIATQPAGQTIFQSLNQTPGLNFTNNDPYGASGGNVRLRGQDGNRVALLWDGIPLNDTGNYATFTNQLLDPELVQQVNVNTGTADVDSPSPAAVGGTINYTSIRPTEDFGVMLQPSVGSFNYRRLLGKVDSGAFGPFGTKAWAAASIQQYDKFRGPGELEKKQGNAYLLQELGG